MAGIDSELRTQGSGLGSAAAIVLAAGESRRMGQDKTLLVVGGRPLIAHTLAAFEACPVVDQVVVVLAPSNAQQVLPLLARFPKVVRTCMGGRRRQDSVRAGLHTLPGEQALRRPQAPRSRAVSAFAR